MASKGFEDLINRTISDESFALLLRNDPDAAMAGFDLTPDEADALRSRDPAKLQSLGLDERISRRRVAGTPWTIVLGTR
ncbi:MAG: Os1348 family NHLP clan protein [Chloroflexota bacterium]